MGQCMVFELMGNLETQTTNSTIEGWLRWITIEIYALVLWKTIQCARVTMSNDDGGSRNGGGGGQGSGAEGFSLGKDELGNLFPSTH